MPVKTKKKRNKRTLKGGGKNNIHELIQKATDDVIDTLNSLKITWFPIEGTLISVLRYGRTFAKIGNRINLTDSDIDVMVIVKDHNDWIKKIKKILNSLVNKKWSSKPKTENTTYSDRKDTCTDKYTIYYHTKSNLGKGIFRCS